MEERENPDLVPGTSTGGETPPTESSGRDQWVGEGEAGRAGVSQALRQGLSRKLGLRRDQGLGAGTSGTWSLEDGSANGSLDAGGRAGDLSPLESWALQDTPWVPSRFDTCKGKGRSDD